MVSETILVALISGGLGLSGSVIVAVLAVYRTRVEQQSEDTRLQAEFLLQRKITALETVYERLEQAYAEIQKSAAARYYRSDVTTTILELESAVNQNHIWMNAKQREALTAVVERSKYVRDELQGVYPQDDDEGWRTSYQSQLENDVLHEELATLEENMHDARGQLQTALEEPIQELDSFES